MSGALLGGLYFGKVGVIFAVMLLMAILLRRHHPHPTFGAANYVTAVRAMLVALVAGLIGEQPLPLLAGVAVGAALAGTALDGVDGWLARRTNMASDFGARFDMEIDALLILALSILALHHEKAGIWVLASGLLRYSFVAAGWLLPWLRRPLSYSRRRQTICVVQIVGLIVTIAPFVPMPWSALAAGTALAMLCGSFLADVVWLWRQSAAATYHAGFSYPLSR